MGSTNVRTSRPPGASAGERANYKRNSGRRRDSSTLNHFLVQPVLFLELARQIGLGQVLEVLVREGVELVLEAARQHALDLLLPGLLLEPGVIQQFLRARDVLLVELDADVARELVGLGVSAREANELGLRDGHALALEGEIDRSLLDHRIDVVAPGIVVHEYVEP